MSAPEVAVPAQILKAGEVIKAGALPNDLSIGGFKIWDLTSFGPAFVTVAFLMFMLVEMARHWTFWRGTGKALDVASGLSPGTLTALWDLEVIAKKLLYVGTIVFGAWLITSSLSAGGLAPSSFVAAVMVVAFAYLIQIVLQGVGVWGSKPAGPGVQNCPASFPLVDAGSYTNDLYTFVCPFAALLQNNIYLFAQSVANSTISWESLVLAAAMAAAKISFTFRY